MSKLILIVEDTEDTREFMKFLLEMKGYKILEAEDGLKAIEVAKQQSPDLILMDVSLPEIDGLTVTKILREADETANIPIIAVTANGKDFYQKALEAGCNDLIPKPIDFNKLEPVIEQYLSK